MKIKLLTLALGIVALSACKKDEDKNTDVISKKMTFKIFTDSTQARLDNLGNPSTIPAGNSAQHPRYNGISAHYIELCPTAFTALGSGTVVYHAAETTAGGDNATDFDQAIITNNGQDFYSLDISNVTPGTYEYVRVSVTYQNYDIDCKANGLDVTGTVASFVGFNTYITSHTVKNESLTLNANRLQGYWAFEWNALGQSGVVDGQAPAGATTVVNPLFASSPIPAGSCVVTGQFDPPLVVTGNESDIQVNLSFSSNNSFEWKDANQNGIYEPLDGDTVVDMGLRGLIPSFTSN